MKEPQPLNSEAAGHTLIEGITSFDYIKCLFDEHKCLQKGRYIEWILQRI